MNIQVVRDVDYLVGIPICVILSIIYSIKRVLGLEKLDWNEAPKKVLFIELSEMGSTVMAYHAMKRLKSLYPKAELYFLVFKTNLESVKILDLIPEKNIFTIRDRKFSEFIIDSIFIIPKLWKARIDTTIDFELFSRFTAIISFLSGARRRIGFYRFYSEGLYRGNFHTHKVQYNPHMHISLNFLALALSLKAPENEIPMLKAQLFKEKIERKHIEVSKEAKQKILNKLNAINPSINERSKLIVIDPNYSWAIPMRSWPTGNYAKLAKMLLRAPNTFVLLTGTIASGSENAKLICGRVQSSRCINLIGKFNLREFIELLGTVDVVITHDSGPAHFASITGTKVIVMFGPETPKVYAPLGDNVKAIYADYACAPCVSAFNERHSACNNNKCMQAISAEEVYAEVQKALRG